MPSPTINERWRNASTKSIIVFSSSGFGRHPRCAAALPASARVAGRRPIVRRFGRIVPPKALSSACPPAGEQGWLAAGARSRGMWPEDPGRGTVRTAQKARAGREPSPRREERGPIDARGRSGAEESERPEAPIARNVGEGILCQPEGSGAEREGRAPSPSRASRSRSLWPPV